MIDGARDVLDDLLARQRHAWSAGDRPRVEDLLSDSSLPPDPDALLDLVYHEIVLRDELGESPCLDEYARRYPGLRDDLALHFEVHHALREDLLRDTPRVVLTSPAAEGGDVSIPVFADYVILGELGRGGMGVVYRGRHRRLKRPAALKMFRPGRIPSPRELARFRAEAEAVARLQHPNIVQIFEVGEAGGLPFLALELAERGTLAQKLQGQPLPPREAAALVEVLARALHHAHERGVVHRDVKPANVLFAQDGTPKVTDFGLAKLLEGDPGHDATRTGEPVGTPRYMAPEQAAGRPDRVGPATDVYALGTVLYECITGRAPFVAPGVLETLEKVRTVEPLSPRRLQPGVPRDLATVCLKCLRKEPEKRYYSAQELADDLRRFREGEPVRARPTPRWERLWKWCRRRPAAATLAAACTVALCAAVATLGYRQYADARRLAALRDEVTALVNDGRDALARQDDRAAREKFLAALAKVRAEPGLADQELGVRGWLDQSLRDGERQRWSRRRPPPLFEDLRDEAFLRAVVLDPDRAKPSPAARRAIADALALTADDPAWRDEREPLVLLDAGLLLRGGDPAAALARLDGTASRHARLLRADCLVRLGRHPEAAAEQAAAANLPDADALGHFLAAVERFTRHDLAAAAAGFEQALLAEPDHFAARCLQAACFLGLGRPGEAKVALTACLAQRPGFAWSYLLRGRACLLDGDAAAAQSDFRRGLDLNPREPARCALLVALGRLLFDQKHWDEARRHLDEAAGLAPDEAAVWLGLAELHARRQQWSRAEQDWVGVR
jgi:tetratricopeptide (TPR) repeat protein